MLFAKKAVRAELYGITNRGVDRANNEDNFTINGKMLRAEEIAASVECFIDGGTLAFADRPLIAAVCDGMGGEDYGEVASAVAAEQLAGLAGSRQSEQTVGKALLDANRSVFDKADELGVHRCGTTAAVVYTEEDRLYASNVGDSRIYLVRGGKAKQLSRDDTEVQLLVESKLITKAEARTSPRRHGLLQYLGMDDEKQHISVYTDQIRLRENDVILLCSDGVTDKLEDAALAAVVRPEQSAAQIARAVVDAALASGSDDNITAVVIRAFC